MTKYKQIQLCQAQGMADQECAEDAEKRGKRQFFCTTCYRWKWADDLCEFAEVEEVR